jgi:hypothetical protein
MLAEKLGMTVAELGQRMDADEFFGWIQYFMAPAEAKKEADISNIKDMVRIAAHGDAHGDR